MESFKPGDHLKVQRSLGFLGLAYYHHGIYKGNNIVIHHSGHQGCAADAQVVSANS